MVWAVSLAVTFLAWLHLKISFARVGWYPSRSKITGCELARQVLDRGHMGRTAVHFVPEVGATPARSAGGRRVVPSAPSFNQLLLPERVYYGTRLADLATSLHETAHLTEEFGAGSVSWARHGGLLLRTVVRLAWLTGLGGIFLGNTWMRNLGQLGFSGAFLWSLVSLGQETQVTERASSQLGALEGFRVDELTRMRQLLQAMRGVCLAEIFRAPFSFVSFKKKIKTGVS